MCSVYLEDFCSSYSLIPACSSAKSVWPLQGFSDYLRRKSRMPCMAVRLHCYDVSCCSYGQQHMKLGTLTTVRK